MRMSLSEHTLDVNVRRCDVELFDWSEVEDYVLTLSGERDYRASIQDSIHKLCIRKSLWPASIAPAQTMGAT